VRFETVQKHDNLKTVRAERRCLLREFYPVRFATYPALPHGETARSEIK
jgi:hypothetical protein